MLLSSGALPSGEEVQSSALQQEKGVRGLGLDNTEHFQVSWEVEKNPATSISHPKNFSATSFVLTAETSDDDSQPTATPGGQSRASDCPESTVDIIAKL